MAKKKLVELDIVRAIAIMAVLVIHTTATASVKVPWGTLPSLVYVVANTMSMFAVPVFILLSGLVLFYRYGGEWSWSEMIGFYRKRILYIVVPYLLWSVGYHLYSNLLNKHKLWLNFPLFWEQLQWGRAGYQLYFIIIILQFYLLFPLLLLAVQRLRMRAGHLIILGLIVQAIFYAIHHWSHPFAHAASLSPNYMFVFCVGGAIGMSYEKFSERSKHLWWTFAMAVGLGFTYLLIIAVSKAGGHFWAPLYTILYNSYAAAMGISLIWIGRVFTSASSRVTNGVVAFGVASFGIYLIHPAVLMSWRSLYSPEVSDPMYHLYNLVSLFIAICISWFLTHWIKKLKFSWLLLGR